MSDEIAPFKVEFTTSEIESFVVRARAVLETGWLVPGPNNAEFERRFAKFLGVPQTVAVASGTAALEVVLRALKVSGRTVLVPANTNYATAEATIRAGCRPVLYDSGLYPDLRAIQRVWTPDVTALMVVHVGGYLSPELPELRRWCDQRDVALIEDASHAHGSLLNGQAAGTFGAAAAFSLFATKVVTTAEGGVIATADPAVATACRRYRDQGKADDGLHHVVFGSAWRMSELHAALGAVQLDGLGAGLTRVGQLVGRYVRGIDHPRVRVPNEVGVSYSGHKFIVITDGRKARESLRAHLLAAGIRSAKGVYEVPLHRQPVLGLDDGDGFPLADAFATSHLCLPMWKGLTAGDADRVIEAVNSWTYGG
ncbi:DegT/DnrJ/EryC1/StrS family aminotransferase [Micromonospora zhanjiangensis]|uniref:DegT/DnrJ/EryC1/StrS family aminotransferase n=1 Tax=Micromonospora zhanjiangensis TaxID=1522057 RepID=A0ABV8KIW2_9ACTN